MATKVTKTPAVYHDLDNIAGYIQQDNSAAAHRFLLAAERLFSLLAAEPMLGEVYPHPDYPDMRFRTLGRPFHNYVVFFRSDADRVEIVRVLHGAQSLPELLDS